MKVATVVLDKNGDIVSLPAKGGYLDFMNEKEKS